MLSNAKQAKAQYGIPLLERAEYALARVKNPSVDFNFGDWSRCTCGQIFVAATGRRSSTSADEAPQSEHSTYLDLLKAVCEANELDVDHGDEWGYSNRYAVAVSDATIDVARRLAIKHELDPTLIDDEDNSYLQPAAVQLLEKTVEMLHQRELQARLDVLAAAGKIVNAVDTSNVPTVTADADTFNEAWDEYIARGARV